MKFINKLRWNHYVILSILFAISVVALFLLLEPVNSGYADEIVEETTTTSITTTINTTTSRTTVATLPTTTSSTSATTNTSTLTDVTTTDSDTATIASEEERVTTVVEDVDKSVETVDTKTTSTDKDETPTSTYVVYKPSTHYIHKNTCHWVDSSCLEITDTVGIECRKCSECNPNMEIVTEFVPETPTVADNDRQMLAEIVWHEAGSSWISQYNKAKVAAGVMNRVNDSRFPNTVYGVLTQPYQFSGYWPGCCTPSQACYDAVDYYFNHTDEFNSDNSWWGDGSQNHFYYQ